MTCTALAQRAHLRPVSCSIFYSRPLISIPLCLYSDATNKLFSLNVVILWFWTDEHSSGFLIPWIGSHPEQCGDIYGDPGSPQPTNNLPLLEKFPLSLTGSKWSPPTSVDGGILERRGWCSFHLLKHLKCIWSKEEKINHSVGSWQGDGQDDLICLSHY